MNNPERAPQGAERGLETIGKAAERQAETLRSPESRAEQSPERRAEEAERALQKAQEQSVSVEKPGREQAPAAPDTHHVRPARSRQAREKAYKDIIRHTQDELPAGARAFSKVIHQSAIEKTSGLVGSTIARPTAILFGAIFALVLSGGVYLVAKYYGYGLSGFETIAAFILGWIVGMVIDFLRLALHKH